MSLHSDTLLISQLTCLQCCVLRGEVTNTNIIDFGLTRPLLEPTIYRTRGEHVNHCTTTDMDKTNWKRNATTGVSIDQSAMSQLNLQASKPSTRQELLSNWSVYLTVLRIIEPSKMNKGLTRNGILLENSLLPKLENIYKDTINI